MNLKKPIMNKKTLFPFLLFVMLTSCSSEPGSSDKSNGKSEEPNNTSAKLKLPDLKRSGPIVGERIDGPANVRNKPDGEVLFQLSDWTLVEATEVENDWLQIMVMAEIPEADFGLDSMKKGRLLFENSDTIGQVLKTHGTSTAKGSKTWAYLYGYTHKSNIYSTSIIENILLQNLDISDRSLIAWKDFIDQFRLDTADYEEFDGLRGYYNYENSIEDPSPGYRILLLFEEDQLVGILHSRDFNLDTFTQSKLDWSYYVSFYNDYPESKQKAYIDYMNTFIRSVD